ncbi:MAG: OOP family OmpA-OmpF porin [Flavobacteriales bacterium]|jgi:outer membrane protein OmpA-like peptidoglycan-associated protein
MSKKTGYLLGILLTIVLCMILSWYFCCGTNDADADPHVKENQEVMPIPVPKVDKATSMDFNLKDPDGNVVFNYIDNFNFDTSQYSMLQPVSGQVDEGIGKLLAYLNADGNADKFLDIRGFYDSDEENTSALASLGLARANAVKNYFVDKGVSSARLNTFGELRDALIPDGTIYKGPIQYKMTLRLDDGAAQDATALKALADRIKDDPLILYFNSAQSSINLNAKQRQQVGDISRYLDKVAGSSLQIIGHTDDTGSRTTNTRLGLNRANFAKNYLIQNGISKGRINTSSKGADEPTASNDTEEDRSQNRRCVVTLNEPNN